MLYSILIGFFVGLVAKVLMPGRDPGGIIVTILLGITGSIGAGYLGRSLGWYQLGEGTGFIGSVIGAMIILFAYRLLTGRRSPSSAN